MTSRQLSKGTQIGHVRACKRFAAWLKRSPETATVDEVRLFQLHLMETGTSIQTRNRTMTGLRFLFRVTMRRLALANEIHHIKEPLRIPQILSAEEAARLLAMAGKALEHMGHSISANTVARLLTDKLGFSRQHNRKAEEGSRHPDRNGQFEHINAKVAAARAAGQPVISVDTKKKELVGNYKNAGSDYRLKGQPQRVNVHDFEDKELGKVVPYGVYDLTTNTAFVSVGITADTAEFAVQAIRKRSANHRSFRA